MQTQHEDHTLALVTSLVRVSSIGIGPCCHRASSFGTGHTATWDKGNFSKVTNLRGNFSSVSLSSAKRKSVCQKEAIRVLIGIAQSPLTRLIRDSICPVCPATVGLHDSLPCPDTRHSIRGTSRHCWGIRHPSSPLTKRTEAHQ